MIKKEKIHIIKLRRTYLSSNMRERLKKSLQKGNIIIYPTDTAYALGGIYNNKKVIRSILGIKGRRDDKFTIIACDIRQVKQFFKTHPYQALLMKHYWPRPLSIVVSPKYSVRVPSFDLCRQLAKIAGKPLIATSANISGEKTPYTIAEALSCLRKRLRQPIIVLDAGKLKIKKTSTIIDVKENGSITVLRQGPVKVPKNIF